MAKLLLFNAHEAHVDSQVSSHVSPKQSHRLLNERRHEMGHLSGLLVRFVLVCLRATDLFIALLRKLKECHEVGVPNGHGD